MFSWGYDGWGLSTAKLKQAVDVIERDRGYQPPYFVEIRFRRSGRAIGFSKTAFERFMGKHRYRWMPELGNKRVSKKTGRKIQIKEPGAVEELLGLALRLQKKRQRVIFFCQCPLPGTAHHPQCHRAAVASLLLKAARRRNVNLTIVEWPGGNPKQITHNLKDHQAEALLRGKKNLPLGRRLPRVELLALPWDSIVHFRSRSHSFYALADPARARGGQWLLPLPFDTAETEDLNTLMKRAEQDRLQSGFEPRRVASR
jgi:hypothetical protein